MHVSVHMDEVRRSFLEESFNLLLGFPPPTIQLSVLTAAHLYERNTILVHEPVLLYHRVVPIFDAQSARVPAKILR